MNNQTQLDRLNRSRNQLLWALANLTVAGICLAFAAWLFLHGKLVAGLVVIVVSYLAVANADFHQRRSARLKGKISF